MEKAEKKKIHLFISQEILEELEGVLKREKFIKRLESREYTVEKAVAKIALISTLIEPNIMIDVIKEDPEDNKVLECAVSAKAKYITQSRRDDIIATVRCFMKGNTDKIISPLRDYWDFSKN